MKDEKFCDVCKSEHRKKKADYWIRRTDRVGEHFYCTGCFTPIIDYLINNKIPYKSGIILRTGGER